MVSPELIASDLQTPYGVAFDTDDRLFVSERTAGSIRRIGDDGKPHAFASTGGRPMGIAFDDSDNGYDHVMPPIINQSNTAAQQGTNLCGESTDGAGTRCAYGPRLPLLAISPYSRRGFVSSTLTDQTSVLRFIEDNWLGAERISADSFDNKAGSIEDMLDFSAYKQRRVMRRPWKLILNPDNGKRRSFWRSR